MFDVITVGSNTIDWFIWTHPEIIHRNKRHRRETLMAYPVGAKILVEEFKVATGGGGTNTAATFSRLGLKTAYLGRVGSDAYGDLVLQDLKKYRVSFLGQRGGNTGFSIILDSARDRTVLAYKGANDDFQLKGLNPAKLQATWFYFSAMIGKSYDSLVQLARWAGAKGVRVAFNPSSYLAARGKRFLGSLLKYVEALILNREEAEAIVGKKPPEGLVQDLAACGPKYVVVTDAAKGVYAYNQGFYYKVPAKKVKVVETLGAGDAFAAAFVTGLILSKDVVSCLKWGMLNAEGCIQKRGAKEGLLSRKNAEREVSRDRRGVEKKKLG